MALTLTEVKKTYDTLIRELHDKIETKETVIEDCDKKFSVIIRLVESRTVSCVAHNIIPATSKKSV